MKIKGKNCDNTSIYTHDSEKDGCDGWVQISLEDCKLKCDANAVPDGCIGRTEPNKTCKFVIWHENPDHFSGRCYLADDSCQIQNSNNKDVQVWEASGKKCKLILLE